MTPDISFMDGPAIRNMERSPYQDPQTSMERHVVELVAHLRDGTDSRAGFAQKTEAALAHAFWLENAYIGMREEVKRLERALMPALPSIECYGKQFDTRDPRGFSPGGSIAFDWGMETIRYRSVWNGYNVKDQDVAKSVKRRAYKDILKLFREQFEKTWTLNMSRRRAA